MFSLRAYLLLLLQALSPLPQIDFWPVLIGSILGVALVARLFIPHPRAWRASMGAWRETVSFRRFVSPATLLLIIRRE